jgi:hypothetical protein|tara:strand:- start:830 stop:1132 length:303 start_codon:yes stop_codon:yes gene_type:complete
MKKTIDIFLDVEFNNKESPERGLFLSVILQALLDATSKKSKVNKDRAISWFFCSVGVTCDNFEQICQHAGLSPSYTRSFAYKVIHSPDIKYVRQRIKKML